MTGERDVETLDHLDEETRQQVEFLAKKWMIPREEALILLQNQKQKVTV